MFPLKHGWKRLNCRAVFNKEEFTTICSFISPAIKINNKRVIIHNREELEKFLKENQTVPHDKNNLFDN